MFYCNTEYQYLAPDLIVAFERMFTGVDRCYLQRDGGIKRCRRGRGLQQVHVGNQRRLRIPDVEFFFQSSRSGSLPPRRHLDDTGRRKRPRHQSIWRPATCDGRAGGALGLSGALRRTQIDTDVAGVVDVDCQINDPRIDPFGKWIRVRRRSKRQSKTVACLHESLLFTLHACSIAT